MWPPHSCFDNTTSQLDWFGHKMYHQQRKRQDHKTNIENITFKCRRRQDGPTAVQRWPQNPTLALVALALTVQVGHNNQKSGSEQGWWTRRWPRDCAGPTAPRPVLGPWVALGRALATSLKPTLPPPILALAKGLCNNL